MKDFLYYMVEREAIRLRKEAGDFPLTDDPILAKYKFTNVKREDDRTTREFKKMYDQHQHALPCDILLNCAIARYFGTYEFQQAVGWQEGFKGGTLKRIAKKRLKEKQRVFTGAYVITNQGISAPKQDVVVDVFIRGLWKDSEMLSQALLKNSFEYAMRTLQCLRGFGGSGFMAKEVLLDTLFFPMLWRPRDLKTYTPMGPGARRGYNRLKGKAINAPYPKEGDMDFLTILMGNAQSLLPHLNLNLHDIQFCLCEYDKYMRTKNGEGRPRSKYAHRDTDAQPTK